MNAKQRRFADEYLICLNGTEAAIKAGYKEKTARIHASRMLSNANIRVYIDEQLERIHSEKTADAKEVMEYLTAVMRGEKKEQILKLSGNGEQEVITISPPTRDRIKAAELIGKSYCIFNEKINYELIKPIVISGEEFLED
ncbi:MAG: terminase small subunit [Clostridia bacterium]|nr:terminase small subunit [Clostridia bacterium]